ERKTIRAPFSGILGLRKVNLGQYLSGGGELVTLQSLSPIYVNFGVPQQSAADISVGKSVRGTTNDAGALVWAGRVTAIDSKVDETTRNIQIQATLANPNGTLRPGMFVQAQLELGAPRSLVVVPASAISYAPFGDSVFVIADLETPDGRAY